MQSKARRIQDKNKEMSTFLNRLDVAKALRDAGIKVPNHYSIDLLIDMFVRKKPY